MITTFTGIAARFTKQSQIDLFKQTLLVDEFAENKATLERAVTSSEANLEWIQKNIPNLRQYIEDYVTDSATANAISFTTVLTVVVFNVARNYF